MDEFINYFYEMVGQYGLYAVFFLAMIEGDITLLLAGALAHGSAFGSWGFAKVLGAGTLGGFIGDQIAYLLGRVFGTSVREYRLYRHVRTRVERLTENFGSLSIFLSKYIYGLRTASCVFYGIGRMSYKRFLLLSLASCFLWVFILSGAGYFFSGAVMNLLGDFHQWGIYLLIIFIVGIAGFYVAERYWLGKKVETADPEKIQKIEHAAQGKLQEIGHEIQERIHLPSALERRKEAARKRDVVRESKSDGD
ncbi:MAG: DedA family protein [Pyrinomonadaceae bacterium]|nr:DedA family protein [Pyrinomonadaceae bacterium]